MNKSNLQGFTFGIIAVVVLLVSHAQGSVIRVAKDGSGSFTVIQDAVNVSAPGDTILIGPGRYDETAPYYLVDSWTAETCIGVEIEDITLLGEDRDSVTIGPSTANYSGAGPHGIVSQIGIQDFHLKNLTVENVYLGALVFGAVDIYNCRFRGCELGIYGFSDNGLVVDNCTISECITGIMTQAPSRDVTIRNCTFFDNKPGLSLISSPNVLVAACVFTGGGGGIQFDRGTTGKVMNCSVSEMSHYNVASIDSQMEIWDNNFGISGYGSIFTGINTVVTGSGNVFEGGLLSTLRLEEGADVSLQGNRLYTEGGYSIWIRGGAGYDGLDVFLNFEENYWGTTDVDSVAASIFDGNDEPTYKAFVDFLPLADGPVPTENSSWGSVKAMFR